jgi:hypothetical protein
MSEALSDILSDDYAIAVEDALAFPPYRPFIDGAEFFDWIVGWMSEAVSDILPDD